MARAGEVRVKKTSGEHEPFDERKLRTSLRRAGASGADRDRVVAAVRSELADGMTTRQVYRIAFQALRQAPEPTAARYSLQRAILELGPSGYPFERFFGNLLRHEGWKTRVGVQLQGSFVRHEVDVEARRDDRRVLCECKFRSDPNGKVDIRTALYVYGRAHDLEGTKGGYSQFWLVTNGRFTPDAQRFGEGMGLYLLGWNHPKGESLRERIDRAGLHPVTCLTHLRKREKERLIQDGSVTVADLRERPRALEALSLSEHRLQQVRAEIDGLCGS